ncbi:DUF4192 domain-containing protein [Salininema proteolyticum]|uniref:DUF4192 domain-containing protein n=1 Tax=Salininema proteolyticum TaxID=1607685 RepID=A0ABV8TXH8_9ACTN
MTTELEDTTVRVSSAAELAGLVPYLLSYEPEPPALAVVGLRDAAASRRPAAARETAPADPRTAGDTASPPDPARPDPPPQEPALPEPPPPAPPSSAQARFVMRLPAGTGPGPADVEHYASIIRHNGCDAVALFAYGGPELAGPLEALRSGLEANAMPIPARVVGRVSRGHLYPAAPFGEGRRQRIPQAGKAVCSMIALGGNVFQSRDDIADLFEPPEPDVLREVDNEVSRTRRDQAEEDADDARVRAREYLNLDYWRSQWRTERQLPAPADIAEIALGLADRTVRDWLLESFETSSDNDVDLWIWTARHLTGSLRGNVAAVAGFAAYRSGNGVLAAEALKFASVADPHCILAELLWHLLYRGIPPERLIVKSGGSPERPPPAAD